MAVNELPPRYEPAQVERRLYARWLEAGAFRANPEAKSRAFCIVIPPPNVTGSLHLGHALDNTLQDILIRFKRMQGFNTCWIPGTDHASIAVTVLLERELKKEGKTRHDLGREKFLERAWAWKEKHGTRIVEQLKLMGCSCDWDRERFTMDEGLSRAVVEHFVRLYEEGLIYRGARIVNWCPRCLTALSDLEAIHRDLDGSLWHIRYPLQGGGEAVVATTRPETMLGDTAVAVHPDDERNRALVGKTAILPLLEREIPVIADAYVDREFGTGTLKITPGHDPNDFEVGDRHKLPVINIFNPDATINEHGGPYAGLSREKARDRVVADLDARGLLVKIEPRRSPIAHCERCSTRLEPLVSKQWWLKATSLRDAAVAAVRLGETDPANEGGIRMVPDNAPAIFHEWMRNLKDWCISRQLWWGHRIPAWHCTSCKEVTVARDSPSKCACGGTLEQDPDTLDTWFSAALWPFSTLGWPGETKEMKAFYPTSVLVTGWDIIFFWVARMIMAGLKLTGKRPFHTVVLHSLITDPEGKKMSKSKGNVMDPLDLFDRYGTDAVRFTLASLETLRQSFRLSEQKVEHSRNFMNKIWNAARFSLPELKDFTPSFSPPGDLSLADRWILDRTQLWIRDCTLALDEYCFNSYAGAALRFFWHDFCDVYIELAKAQLKDKRRRGATQWTLHYVLDTAARLMHPGIPYITEEIWQRLPGKTQGERLLMLDNWPAERQDMKDGEAAGQMEDVLGIAESVRTLKHEQGLALRDGAEIAVVPADERAEWRLNHAIPSEYLGTLTGASFQNVAAGKAAPTPNVSIVVPGFSIYMRLKESADPAAERQRLAKEKEELEALLNKTTKTLANKDYLAKAPPEIVEEAKRKAGEYEARVGRLATRLGQLP